MKNPLWFEKWRGNEFAHLERKVDIIKRDIGWLKWLTGGILLAIIATAIAILAG